MLLHFLGVIGIEAATLIVTNAEHFAPDHG